MNIHANKVQETSGNAIANSMPLKQMDGQSVLELFEDRPASIQLKSLQDMADNSAQVKQLKAYQLMAENSPQAKEVRQLQETVNNSVPPSLPGGKQNEVVTQLKWVNQLDKNKLTLAGEDHSESDVYRKKEQDLCKKELGGEYWTESEFTFEKNEKEVFGDPSKERFIRAAFILSGTQNSGSGLFSIDDLSQFYESKAPDLVKASLTLQFKSLSGESNRFMDDDPKGWEIFKPHFDSITESIRSLFDGVRKITSERKEELIKSIKYQLSEITKKYEYGWTFRNSSKVNVLDNARSESMRKAAIENNNTKTGVWKIGDGHIADIKSADKQYGGQHFDMCDRESYVKWYNGKSKNQQEIANLTQKEIEGRTKIGLEEKAAREKLLESKNIEKR